MSKGKVDSSTVHSRSDLPFMPWTYLLFQGSNALYFYQNFHESLCSTVTKSMVLESESGANSK